MMKKISLLFLALVAVLTLATTCNRNPTGTNGNNGDSTGTTVVTDTSGTVVHTDTTKLEDTLLPTGGIKPLPVTPEAVREKLYNQYKSGEIEMCMWKGNTVYRCSRNAPDAGSEVFDHQGNKIGKCYYSTRQVDPVCEEATECKVIYRVAKNIWGKPEVVWGRN
jgi:hypothetical protein